LGATGVKAVSKYVGEIEPRCQFHQHFTCNFFANIFAPKKLQSQNVSKEKLRKALSHEKSAGKMFLKLTTGFQPLLGNNDFWQES